MIPLIESEVGERKGTSSPHSDFKGWEISVSNKDPTSRELESLSGVILLSTKTEGLNFPKILKTQSLTPVSDVYIENNTVSLIK